MTASERRLVRILGWVAGLAACVLSVFFGSRAIDARSSRLRTLRTELDQWKEREREAAMVVPLSALLSRIQTLETEIGERDATAEEPGSDPYVLAEALRSTAAGRGLALLTMQVDPARAFISFSLSGRAGQAMRFMEDLARIPGVLSIEELSLQQGTAPDALLLSGKVAFGRA